MSKNMIADEGDCLINLSSQQGFFWETIWNHPKNAALRNNRKNLNILKKGDTVFIPDRTLRQEARATEQRHQFVKKGMTAKFTLTLLDRGEPRANEPYVLVIDGKSRKGQTDGDGKLTEAIPPMATEGLLLVGKNREPYTLNFGYIDPIEGISGVKTRLQNLGFYRGEINDEVDPETTAAIAEFQRSANLAGEGKLNDDTRNALVAAHGS